ncbi:MAG: hypothetical protein ACRD4O_01835 [Bryobacteraceae bacterium]
MPESNGDYLSRFERVERNLDRVVAILEDVAEQLDRHTKILDRRAEMVGIHEDRLARAETLMAEMTDKVNFLIEREMKREGGPESI